MKFDSYKFDVKFEYIKHYDYRLLVKLVRFKERTNIKITVY